MNIKYVIAGLLIILGVGLLLDSFDVWEIGNFFQYLWPTVIIVMGLAVFSKGGKSYFAGSAIILVGVLLLIAPELPGGFWGTLWPALLILIGIFIIKSKIIPGKAKIKNSNSINVNGVFSSSYEKVESEDLGSGTINGIFSATNVDLTASRLRDNAQILEINAIFGDVRLIVPSNWKINASGTPIFGSLQNSTARKTDPNDVSPLLTVNYLALFGSIKIYYDKSIPIH